MQAASQPPLGQGLQMARPLHASPALLLRSREAVRTGREKSNGKRSLKHTNCGHILKECVALESVDNFYKSDRVPRVYKIYQYHYTSQN